MLPPTAALLAGAPAGATKLLLLLPLGRFSLDAPLQVPEGVSSLVIAGEQGVLQGSLLRYRQQQPSLAAAGSSGSTVLDCRAANGSALVAR